MPKVKPIRIALCMIVKDDSEADIFDRCLDSFTPYVQGLYVAVTGTSGEHKKIHEIVKKYKGKSISTNPETHPQIYSKVNDKWIFTHFAEARNVSFGMVDEEYDYLTWADVDDVLASGEELQKTAIIAREKKYDSVMFNYLYAVRLNEQGEVEQILIEHMRERLLKPNKFKWVSRLHEVCVPKDNNFKPKQTYYPFDPQKNQLCTWIHLTTEQRTSQTIERNALILKLQIEEEQGKDPRTKFYLAKTLFDLNTPESLKEALTLLEEYREQSGWDAERANSWEYTGLIYQKQNDNLKAVETYHNAVIEYPLHILPYLRLADAYKKVGNLEFSNHWLSLGMQLEIPKNNSTIGNTYEIKLLAATLMYQKAFREQNIKEMVEWAGIRANLMGKDDGLYGNVMYSKLLNDAAMNVFNLSKWLKDSGYIPTITDILEVLPQELVEQPYAAFIANNVLPPKKWGKKEIAYIASFGGKHFEEWGPENLKTGIGGSETAVLELTREWAKMGYQVTVYCDCGSQAGEHGGVIFKPYYMINWNDEFNILILWRSPHLLDKKLKAKKIIMDLHDIASPFDWSKERWESLGKIFVKSKYHRSNLPDIPDDKFVIVGNGIRI
jgi:tetratricopeptide (TPR) repeat protein